MKAKIDREGCLTVTAESELESYALQPDEIFSATLTLTPDEIFSATPR